MRIPMNQYITNNQPNENLIYVLDYLGISIDEFLEMSDEKIISIYKRSADALNDGVMTKGSKATGLTPTKARSWKNTSIAGINRTGFEDEGSKSRYFDLEVWAEKHGILQFPKASKRERNGGCERLKNKKFTAGNYSQSPVCKTCNLTLNGTNDHSECSGEVYYREMESKNTGNSHPTVKPLALMRYLCRLITPPNGLILDPFMGSGTTGVATLQEGFRFIGIEIEEEYCKIAEARIKNQLANMFNDPLQQEAKSS